MRTRLPFAMLGGFLRKAPTRALGQAMKHIDRAGFFSHVPEIHPIPKLNVIEKMVSIANRSSSFDFSKTYLIGVQHILETTSTIFDGFVRMGFKPENMRFIGKPYSTSGAVANTIRNLGINLEKDFLFSELGQYNKYNARAINKMWQNAEDDLVSRDIERIIVLDEGGRCLEG